MTPLLMSIKDTCKTLHFSRFVVTRMIRRGDIKIVPCEGKDGKPSRKHHKVVVASVVEWVNNNAVAGAEELKAVLDGRRAA